MLEAPLSSYSLFFNRVFCVFALCICPKPILMMDERAHFPEVLIVMSSLWNTNGCSFPVLQACKKVSVDLHVWAPEEWRGSAVKQPCGCSTI